MIKIKLVEGQESLPIEQKVYAVYKFVTEKHPFTGEEITNCIFQGNVNRNSLQVNYEANLESFKNATVVYEKAKAENTAIISDYAEIMKALEEELLNELTAKKNAEEN